ncbi:MAG: hypothetical protein IPH78_00410 [Bacteroidetes bacterium]|nr:hypothetical protein [Bacteroidota bacterium]
MKKFSLVVFTATLFAAIVGISSCNKALELGLKLDAEQICIPAQQFVVAAGVPQTFTIPVTKIQSEFAANGVTFDLNKIKTATFKNYKIKVNTSSANFNYVGGVSVYAKAEGAAGNGEQIAYTNLTGSNVTEVDLLSNGVNLKSLLNGNIVVTVLTFNNANNSPETCFSLENGTILVETSK